MAIFCYFFSVSFRLCYLLCWPICNFTRIKCNTIYVPIVTMRIPIAFRNLKIFTLAFQIRKRSEEFDPFLSNSNHNWLFLCRSDCLWSFVNIKLIEFERRKKIPFIFHFCLAAARNHTRILPTIYPIVLCYHIQWLHFRYAFFILLLL